MDYQIQVVGEVSCPVVSLSSAAFEAKQVALEASEKIQEIVDFDSLDAASKALTQVKWLIKSIEESRKLVKQPILNAGRQVDEIARKYCAELEVQAKRLSSIAGAYQEAEKRKTERARQEAMEKERQTLIELEARQRVCIEEGGERQKVEQDLDTMTGEAAHKIAEIRTELANVIGPKPNGLTARRNWKFEVVDIHALSKSYPELCIISPNNVAIRVLIKTNQNIPGLRIWSETGAVVRLTADSYDY